MTIEQEDKLRNTLGIVTLVVFMPLNQFFNRYLDNENAEVSIVISIIAIFLIYVITMFVLTYRKFIRDKNQGNDLKRYKIMIFFIGLSFLIFLGSLFFIY